MMSRDNERVDPRAARGVGAALLLGALLLHASQACAQRTDDNAVTAAADAFGSSVGSESIGIYSSTQVRGFSPVSAGNVRIEGMYFDRQARLTQRLVDASTIHVGLSAQGYPFPSPTGIVEYGLHAVGTAPMFSMAVGTDPYLAPLVEVDGKWPLAGASLGMAGGLSYANEEYAGGGDARYWRAALIPRWRPSERLEITPFWSLTRGRGEEAAPVIVTAGSWLPPRIDRRTFFGQSWAENDTDDQNYGVLAKARVGVDWELAAGLFRSVALVRKGFANVYADTRPDGLTRELIIADPRQRSASTSGEARASRSFAEKARLHTVHFSVRARQQDSLYGGSADALDGGVRQLGRRLQLERPAGFAFGERTRDEVRQSTFGIAYEGRWREVGEATLGLQRTDYEKNIRQPGLAPTNTKDDPWLANATVAAYLSPTVALYVGYTRGLEESGVAPDNAANRNEALPAIRTVQADAGVRWSAAPGIALVAGVFDVQKPYFTTDDSNTYTTLGTVRNRGIEASLVGAVGTDLSVVAGAVLMRPRVTGEAVEPGRVGNRPVGQTERILHLGLDYRPQIVPSLSLDLALAHSGERAASSDGIAMVPPSTLVDIGLRYRLKVGKAPATLRVQAFNLTDEFVWSVLGSNSFALTDGRRYSALFVVDF